MKAMKIALMLLLVAAVVISTGCAARQTVKKDAPPVDEGAGMVEETKEEAPPEAMKYVVRKGDTLWDISSKGSIYSDPFQWPLLFKANRDQVEDPDIIEIGQEFNVRKDWSSTEVSDAVKKAQDTPPYVPHTSPRKKLPLKY